MKIIYAISGLISLVLGIIGIFLPLLPTTPFLLLSAALFARSSTRLYNWLLNHRVLGAFIRNYREDKSVTVRVKIVAISTLWATMLFSIFLVVNEKWWLQVMLGTIATGVTIFIMSLKTRRATKIVVKTDKLK